MLMGSDGKDMYNFNYKRFLLQINAVELLRCIMISTKISYTIAICNIDNNKKCSLSTKSACQNDVTLRTGGMASENSAVITGIHYIFKNITIETNIF